MQPDRWTVSDQGIQGALRHVRFKRRNPSITVEEHQNYLKRLQGLLRKSGRPLLLHEGAA